MPRGATSVPLLLSFPLPSLPVERPTRDAQPHHSSRAVSRRSEIGIRLALGAPRGQLIRQLLIEGGLLAFAGALPGIAFALWGARSLLLLFTAGQSVSLDVPLSPVVLAFALALAVITTILLGLVPAVRATRLDVNSALQSSARGTLTGGEGRSVLRSALFGLLSYLVTQSTHEIGIRMALGAQRSAILAMILRGTGFVVFIGAVSGIGAALAISPVIRGYWYGVQPYDPWSIAAAALSLFTVALIACWIPARRAARVDPMLALRHE